jgi:2-dehydro-3-deoxyphosphogalactonate aldolase
VIRAAVDKGLVSCRAPLLPPRRFAALDAGAAALKLFPAEGSKPGVSEGDPRDLAAGHAGAAGRRHIARISGGMALSGSRGFGLGSALYQPGMSADEVAARARDFIAAWKVA